MPSDVIEYANHYLNWRKEKQNITILENARTAGFEECLTLWKRYEAARTQPDVGMLLDEKAFNTAFEENKLYKPDIDHHWVYCFVRYYESAKQRQPGVEALVEELKANASHDDGRFGSFISLDKAIAIIRNKGK